MGKENEYRITCEGLTKHFAGTRALEGVSLTFPVSGIVALIGPNGAGKTTLLNVLTGFTRADSGSCFIGVHEITNLSPYQIARLGVARTFQDVRLILQMTTFDNVMLARPRQRGERLLTALTRFRVSEEEVHNREEVMRTLSFVELDKKADELAGSLSYGQQKLLSIACCLATEGEMLFLDEPVAGVHPEVASHTLDLLTMLRDSGKLIIFIEHDIDAVRRIADDVVVMDEGRIIAQGPPEDVLTRREILEAYLA